MYGGQRTTSVSVLETVNSSDSTPSPAPTPSPHRIDEVTGVHCGIKASDFNPLHPLTGLMRLQVSALVPSSHGF